MPSEDGRLEVAIAIAMTTKRVTVDTTVAQFRTSPPDLFARRFRDVGITENLMPLFKSNLIHLLPRLNVLLRDISNNADLLISDVAALVQLGLDTREEVTRTERESLSAVSLERIRSAIPELFEMKWQEKEFELAAGANEASTLQSKRVVSVGFSGKESIGEPLRSSTPLLPGEEYYLWMAIGAPVLDSIDLKYESLPEEQLPSEARLKVALFAFDEGLQITTGSDVGEFQLAGDGTASVSRQPMSVQDLQNIAGDSGLFFQRLFFPVRTSQLPGVYRLRCNIYHEQVLVQSRLIRAHVKRSMNYTKGALSSRVDYTLSRTLSPRHIAGLEPHRLSLMLNDNGNGTTGFRFFGQGEFKNDASFDGQELEDWLSTARGALRRATWGDKEPWQAWKSYRYGGPPDILKLKDDLINFAIWGYTFYDAIINRLTGGTQASDNLRDLMFQPGLVQVALKQSPRFVIPAAMIYDYGLDTNADAGRYSLCPDFIAALKEAGPLENSSCFQGMCPARGSATVVCPSGFWGYRHSIGMPLSLKSSPEVDSALSWTGKPEFTVGVSTDAAFTLRLQHEKALRALRTPLGWNYAATRDDVFKLLKENKSQLIYFYCHGGTSGNTPFIQVGSRGEHGITRDNLRFEKIRWRDPRPLVFINGCHTAALEPDVAIEFISAFIEVAGASGVIGTEITIFEPLAGAFAEECLRRFLAGEQIGTAVRGARLKLLKDCNPLGLVYIPYVIASLHLVEQ